MLVEQNTLTFQFLKVVAEGEVLKVYAQIRIQLLPPRSVLVLRMVFTGVFRTIPQGKKCEVGSALRVGTGCGLYFMNAGGL